MGCCFPKPNIENDVFLPEHLSQPLVSRWDHLVVPGADPDSPLYEDPFQLARPPSPRSYKMSRRFSNQGGKVETIQNGMLVYQGPDQYVWNTR